MPTIADLAAHHDLTVVAVPAELTRHVRWAVVAFAPLPGRLLRGGELVLTEGSATGTTELVAELVAAGAAGLVLVGEAPAAAAMAAEAAGLPLLVAPDADLTALQAELLGRLLGVRAAEGNRLALAQRRLLHAADGGDAAVVATAAELVGGWATIVARGDRLLHPTGGARLHVDDAIAAASGFPRRVRHLDLVTRRIGPERPGAATLVIGFRPGRAEFAREIAGHAADLLSLLAARPATGANARARRLALAGLLESPAALRRRIAEDWGLGEVDLVVARVRSRSRSVSLEETALRWVEDLGVPVLVAGEGPTVTAVMPVDVAPEWCGRLEAAVRYEGLPVRCGLGTKSSVGDLRSSLRQAEQALEVALADGRVIADYADLPTSRLLGALHGASAFAERALAPLAGAGAQADTLLTSLHVFLAENGNVEAAAAQLGVHRHTLRHRMQRIQELTGKDLSRMEDRVELWVALRVRGFE